MIHNYHLNTPLDRVLDSFDDTGSVWNNLEPGNKRSGVNHEKYKAPRLPQRLSKIPRNERERSFEGAREQVKNTSRTSRQTLSREIVQEKGLFEQLFGGNQEQERVPQPLRNVNSRRKGRESITPQRSNEAQEPSIWEKLFGNFQPSGGVRGGNPMDDPELGNILQGRSELRKRYNKKKHKWETYRQTMCAKEGRLAFEHMTGRSLPPGDALEKFRKMRNLGWPVVGDGRRPLDISSIPQSGPFCLGTPASSARNRKYGHLVAGKDGYVFDAYMSKAPIPLAQYAQRKQILYAYNPSSYA